MESYLTRGGGALGYETMRVYRYVSYPLPCFCSWIRTTIGITSTGTRSPSSLLRSSPPIASEDGGASHA